MTARKLAVSLSNTSTDTSFDGSADVTNIKTTGTLGIANGGTGRSSVTAGNYLVGNGTSALQEHTPNTAANNMLSALPEWTANPTDGVKLIRRDTGGSASFGQVTFLTVWNYIKDKISSVLGLSTTGYTGNAATATAFSDGTAKTKFDGIAEGATKVEASATNGKVKINGTDTTVYTHPSQTAYTSKGTATKVPQITTDSTGHVTGITEVTISGVTPASHTHGNIQNGGALQTNDITIASGDKLVVTDSSDSNKVARASVSFDGSTTTKALTQKGTFETFLTSHQDISGKMATDCSNKASGALQNLTAQLTEGTSPFTDNTEMFTSYAGNNGFAESGHVNQPYRRKASSMLTYIESKRFNSRNPAQNDVGTGTKRIQLGYALKTGAGYCNYIVHVFFNTVAGSLTGCGVTLLVNYDWNTTSQKAKCVILNDNGLRAAGYNIVLANFLSNDGTNQWMHITLGLVKNSEPGTLVAFAYSYCGIFRVNSDVNWVHSIASDTVGSYDQLVQAVLTDADTVDGYHIQFGSYSSRSDTISFY